MTPTVHLEDPGQSPDQVAADLLARQLPSQYPLAPPRVITLIDTGPLVAVANADDMNHAQCMLGPARLGRAGRARAGTSAGALSALTGEPGTRL
jgi:hypothetical protein